MKIHLILVAVMVFIIIFFSLHTQHTGWIEMLIYPYLANHGFLLYKDLIDPHTPILVWILQFLTESFGYTPSLLIVLTILISIVNSLLIYVFTKKISKDGKKACLAAGFYILWFFYFEGNGLWFELFQTPFIIITYYYWRLFFIDKNKINLIIASLFLGLSFFIKQSVFWIFLIIVGLIIVQNYRNFRKIISQTLVVLLSFILIFGVVSAITLIQGNFSDFFYWSFIYTFFQFPFSPGHQSLPTVMEVIKLFIPLSALLPLIVFQKKNFIWIFNILFLAATFMSIFPRWGLFHLQPFLAILAIIAVPLWLDNRLKNFRLLCGVMVIIWFVVVIRQDIRFWNMPVRFFEPSIYHKAAEVKSITGNLYITFNSNDQFYVLNGNLPIKPYVQNFAWFLELPGMQDRVISSLVKNKVPFIVFTPASGKGGVNTGDYLPSQISQYVFTHYVLYKKISQQIWILKLNNYEKR